MLGVVVVIHLFLVVVVVVVVVRPIIPTMVVVRDMAIHHHHHQIDYHHPFILLIIILLNDHYHLTCPICTTIPTTHPPDHHIHLLPIKNTWAFLSGIDRIDVEESVENHHRYDRQNPNAANEPNEPFFSTTWLVSNKPMIKKPWPRPIKL